MRIDPRRALVATMQVLAGPALVLGIAIGGLAAFQRHMIYPLGYDGLPAPAAPAGYDAVRMSSPSGMLTVWRHAGRPDRPVLLFLHGNATDVAGIEFIARPFADAGWTIVSPEYPGYAGSDGSPSQAGLLDAARTGWRMATDGRSPGDVVVMGNSIGSGPAIALAAETSPRGLAVVSGIASLPQVVRARLPFIPDVLVRDRFYNAEAMRRVTSPVMVVHGDRDDVVPFSQGIALAAAARVALLSTSGGHEIIGRRSVQRLVLHRFQSR